MKAGAPEETAQRPRNRLSVPLDSPIPAPELAAWLAANRESLIRRWLELVVERSTLEELAARPIAERVRELDLLLEAARSEGAGRHETPDPALDEAVTTELEAGGPVAVALIAPPAEPGVAAEAWSEAAAEVARAEEQVVTTADGLVAVVLRAGDAPAARVEADRVRAGAWQVLGGGSRLPDVGVAVHPEDGVDAASLVAAARARLPELSGPAVEDAAAAERADPGEEIRAERGDPGSTLRDELDRWARRTDERDGEGPPAEVTPLYPPTPD